MGKIKSLPLITKLSNQSGQFLIESVLLMLVTIGLFVFFSNQLRSMDFVKNIVQEPWAQVAGMIESGSWLNAQRARQLHPNQTDRGVSFDPQAQ